MKSVLPVYSRVAQTAVRFDAGEQDRPGLIKSILTVDVPRLRTMKSMKDPDFANCIDKISMKKAVPKSD